MDFCGFERIDFTFQGREAILVLPNKENEKKNLLHVRTRGLKRGENGLKNNRSEEEKVSIS